MKSYAFSFCTSCFTAATRAYSRALYRVCTENAEVLASSVRAESTKRGSVLKVFEGIELERLCRDGAWTFVEKESVPLSTLVMTSDEFQETWSNLLYVARQDAL